MKKSKKKNENLIDNKKQLTDSPAAPPARWAT